MTNADRLILGACIFFFTAGLTAIIWGMRVDDRGH